MSIQTEILSTLNDHVESLIDIVSEQTSQNHKLDELIENVSLLKNNECILKRSFIDLSEYLSIYDVVISGTKKENLREYLTDKCLARGVANRVLALQDHDIYPVGLLNHLRFSDSWSHYFHAA